MEKAMTDQNRQQDLAKRFGDLHDDFLTIPNVWDAGSVHLIAQTGASAIATSSGAQSWAQGIPDGRRLDQADVLANVKRIVDAVDLSVSADVENGYADSPDNVRDTIAAFIVTGIVGINVEDSGAPDTALYEVDAQAQRIAAARDAANSADVDLFINALTDVLLLAVGEEEGRIDDVIARGNAYREAGADGLFISGLLDTDALTTLTRETGLKINAMWLPGAPMSRFTTYATT